MLSPPPHPPSLFSLVLIRTAATASVEGKMSKGLKKVLKKVYSEDLQDQLAVADAKLGSVIKVRSV